MQSILGFVIWLMTKFRYEGKQDPVDFGRWKISCGRRKKSILEVACRKQSWHTSILSPIIQEETRKHVFRGERGPWPPSILVYDQFQQLKRGRGFLAPPRILCPAKTYCQFAIFAVFSCIFWCIPAFSGIFQGFATDLFCDVAI